MRKAKTFKSILCLWMTAAMLLPFSGVLTLADPGVGTHCFYMECDASVTGGKSDGFMIDLYTDSTDALATYWSNANWHMDLTASRRIYRGISGGGGAYAGVQLRSSETDTVGIMSMWKWSYRDSDGQLVDLYPQNMTDPSLNGNNEGSGISCIKPYDWQFRQWNRQLLYCWRDGETGHTFIGTWFYSYEYDKWTLFTYYDTKLTGSYIKGGISQFLENWSADTRGRTRDFRYRNVYFLPHESTEWVSSPKVKVFTDNNLHANGTCTMGQSEDGSYVWGKVVGSQPDDNFAQLSNNYTLTQPASPSYGTPAIKSLSASKIGSVYWKMEDTSTPQLSYDIRYYDVAGNELAGKHGTRPDADYAKVEGVKTDVYRCVLTIRDVFGQTATAEITSPAYDEAVNQPAVRYGDVNSDSAVNKKDSLLLKLYLADPTANPIDLAAADVNGDGVVNKKDSLRLKQYLAGWDVEMGAPVPHKHDYTSVVTTAPTCTDEGMRTFTCFCGDSYTERIPALGHDYVNGVCTRCGGSNGEPTFDTSDWVEWLIDVDGQSDAWIYNMFFSGQTYGYPLHDGAAESSPWEFWGEHFHLCYMFDRDEIDLSANVGSGYEFVWEIWYRDAETRGAFKKIVTAPWSVYNNYSWDGIIYRIPTYNEGINDMYLHEGETSHKYEFVFVIYRDEISPENVVGWQQDWINYTDSTEMFIEDAKDYGFIV